ncbi:hypothetical protein C6502_20755 [Candidatus Poribacteria bacterium]|nr:MAG: hypothetical protein C6502_20755 [Candidatus Poribacteria bacterium]
MHRRTNLAHLILAGVLTIVLTPLMTAVDAQAQIAFVSNRDGNFEIYVMGINGKNQRRLTKNRAGDWSPSWSPDGKQIAFMSERDGNREIYVMDAAGKNQRRLTNNRHSDISPSWSPDGKRIAFSSFRDGNYEIYVMDANGGKQRNLSKHDSHDLYPAWYAPPLSVAPAGKTLTTWGWLKQVER